MYLFCSFSTFWYYKGVNQRFAKAVLLKFGKTVRLKEKAQDNIRN